MPSCQQLCGNRKQINYDKRENNQAPCENNIKKKLSQQLDSLTWLLLGMHLCNNTICTHYEFNLQYVVYLSID